MANWIPLDFDQRVFQNVAETSLTRASATMENIYLNEAGGHSRFPGLKKFARLPNENGPVVVTEFRDDLMAISSTGRLYSIDRNSNAEDVTGVPLTGGLRPRTTQTEDELVIAAGGQILRYAGVKTEILSRDAPIATHVAYVDGFLVANERDSGRFKYSNAGEWRVWDPLNLLSAESNPDIVTSVVVTPYRELLISGPKSVEQYERLLDGTTPFFRRWAVGEGLGPSSMLFPADNGVWLVNNKFEFVRASGQTSQPKSNDVQMSLNKIDSWEGGWIEEMLIGGQKFMLMAIPNATNIYGTTGVTLVFDYKNNRWFNLYGWDDQQSLPSRWPGASYVQAWGRHFVGSYDGQVYEFDANTFDNDGKMQRLLYRSGHYDRWGPLRLDGLKLRLARGDALHPVDQAPKFQLRVNKDNARWTRWMDKDVGRRGDKNMNLEYPGLGNCDQFQIEYMVTDPCRWELSKAYFTYTART